MNLAFHHLGVGTTRFDEALATYEALGYSRTVVVDDVGLNVRVGLLAAPLSPLVEVVAPLGPDGPLSALIGRKALPSPYHTAYGTPALEGASDALRDRGFMPLGEPKPALAFRGARIWYHFHLAVGLLELVEVAP